MFPSLSEKFVVTEDVALNFHCLTEVLLSAVQLGIIIVALNGVIVGRTLSTVNVKNVSTIAKQT